MTAWAETLARATALRDAVEADHDAIETHVDELLELATHDEWSVQRAAVDALALGLQNRPEVGVSRLDALVARSLDSTVPCPGRWRRTLRTVVQTAPVTGRDAIVDGFETVPPEQRGESGTASVTRALEQVAIEANLANSLATLRDIFPTAPPAAQRHLLGTHLALVDTDRLAVRPVLPHLLSAFETANSDTRRVATDLLCALAADDDDGGTVVATLLEWLASTSRTPRNQWRRHDPRDSIMHPTLTDAPPAGQRGVAMAVARIAEETPAAVAPHVDDIASSLAAWESTRVDQWPRSHLTRAVAAVARQCSDTAVSAIDDVATLLTDDSEFVRYWATQAMLSLYPERPATVSSTRLGELLTDTNPDVRTLSTALAAGCVADSAVDPAPLVERVVAAHTECDRADSCDIGVLEPIARDAPAAVQPVLSTLEPLLGDTLDATDTAAIFKAVAETDPRAIADAVPTLVDCLFSDSIVVREAVAETLITAASARPSLLEDQLSVLVTVLETESTGVDSVADVLATVGDRPLDGEQTVFESVLGHSSDDDMTTRRTATRLLATFVEAGTGDTDAAVDALVDRLQDADERIREAALDGVATHVVETQSGTLVQSLYRTGTDGWRASSATLLARVTLHDGSWPSPEFQQWLADRLRDTEGKTRQSFVDATGYICGETDATEPLVTALLACLDDDAIAETAFSTVKDIVSYGATTVPGEQLAPAVERRILDPRRSVPSACIALVPHVTTALTAPQRVADRLYSRLTTHQRVSGSTVEALAALCRVGVKLQTSDVVATLERYATEQPISASDWTCHQFGRLLFEHGDQTKLCETFGTMARDGSTDHRRTAYQVLASVADEWPAGVEPLAETLRSGVTADDDSLRGAALSALVAVGRASPAVLQPVARRLTSSLTPSEEMVTKRRRYEALALLAEAESVPNANVYTPIQRGLVANDGAVTEYSLRTAAALDDPRLVAILRRLDGTVPEWDTVPAHCPTAAPESSNELFSALFTTDEPKLTASDVLDRLDR